jgi:membrane-bound lytic murein transglycosylase D
MQRLLRLNQMPGAPVVLVALAVLTACGPSAASRTTTAPTPRPAPRAAPNVSTTSAGDSNSATAALDTVQATLASAAEQVLALDTADADAPTSSYPVAADATATEPVTWDIEVNSYLSHDRVEFYMDRFTGDARERIGAWLQRGRRYEPMIRKTFRANGIPEDMYYLGLVESGYDPHAYSRAAAVGMWQFMTATARGMGLKVNWWIDERRDPIRSTWAAARFLAALRDQFGSLYLAAAAYNGGPARLSRGISQNQRRIGEAEGDDVFFALLNTKALRAETSNYVPQLIAAAAIGKEPHKYGIVLDSVSPFAYDSVRVPPSTALPAVARASGVHVAAIKDLNPHLLRGVSSPTDSMWVRVPVGRADVFKGTFAALPDSVRTPWKRVKAKKGATVAGMAKSAGLTVTQLRWYNPSLKGTKIATGATVLVPKPEVVEAAFNVPDPAIERYGAASRGVHIVRRGETLGHIARKYRTSVSRLMSLNRLKKTTIYAGQALRIR